MSSVCTLDIAVLTVLVFPGSDTPGTEEAEPVEVGVLASVRKVLLPWKFPQAKERGRAGVNAPRL